MEKHMDIEEWADFRTKLDNPDEDIDCPPCRAF